MNIWGKMLKLFGWKVDFQIRQPSKCVICVAPHTSNWDFVLGLAAYRSVGRNANFLMKKSWFFWPMGCLFRHFGGIPVNPVRKSGVSLTRQIVDDFARRDYLNLAVTPEGTRSRRPDWHTGMLHIAYDAGVPVQLGVIDYKEKRILISQEFRPTGDIERDMAYVKDYYRRYGNCARYPEKFSV